MTPDITHLSRGLKAKVIMITIAAIKTPQCVKDIEAIPVNVCEKYLDFALKVDVPPRGRLDPEILGELTNLLILLDVPTGDEETGEGNIAWLAASTLQSFIQVMQAWQEQGLL